MLASDSPWSIVVMGVQNREDRALWRARRPGVVSVVSEVSDTLADARVGFTMVECGSGCRGLRRSCSLAQFGCGRPPDVVLVLL